VREETHELPSELAAERFRGLALRYRGRTGLTQRELAARVGVHVRSIQDWEAGLSRPTRDRLRRLVLTYLRSGGFVVGQELAEARVLWQAAAGESRRSPVPFDEAWFAELLAEGPAAVERPAASGDQDWGEAPDVSRFIDRRSERATLGRWIVDEQVRVVQVVGLPGVGKTLLATRVAQEPGRSRARRLGDRVEPERSVGSQRRPGWDRAGVERGHRCPAGGAPRPRWPRLGRRGQ
jgi:transcriptional regulator with XRE-family HTH domain